MVRVHCVKQYAIRLDTLPWLVSQNKSTKHSSVKITPIEASKKSNEGLVYFNLFGEPKREFREPLFKLGDKVRISKYKRKVFEKSYTENWTEEMFVVDKIQFTNPITYLIKNLNGEEIKESFLRA